MSGKTTKDSPSLTSDLSELKELLFKKQQAAIEQKILQAEEEASRITPEKIADALPGAFDLNLKKNPQYFGKKLKPTIELAMEESVRENPGIITDIIFPIIGPAIRRSVSETFRKMVQNTNRVVEESMSFKGLKWRAESILTGKSYSEIVLLNSLVYRVEHLFLVHKDTGLLIEHIVNPNVSSDSVSDSDMVSSMFSAIQDFARDAFQEDNHAGIRSLAVGETTVWVERGPHAFLAAVIRGEAPSSLRGKMQLLMEKLHKEQNNAMRSFQGDLDERKKQEIIETLDDCFEEQYSTEEKTDQESKKKKLKLVQYALLALAIGALGFFFWQQIAGSRANKEIAKKLTNFERILAREPGIALTSSKTIGKPPKLHLRGLKDPLAANALKLAERSGVTEHVDMSFADYLSADMEIVRRRFSQKTNPPGSVKVFVSGRGVLKLSGKATRDWKKTASAAAVGVPGLNEVNMSEVRSN